MRWPLLLGLAAVLSACAGAPRCPPGSPAAPAAAAVPTAKPAVIGETLTLDSAVLGERRVVNVYLPPGYASSTDRYPVLYMPDGGLGEDFPHVVGSVDVSIKNGVIRPVIVVGVENTERRRDLIGPTEVPEEQALAPHAGGADRFRGFLRDELMPWVAARYRTSGERAIVGESAAGLFVVETLIVEPTLFDAYVAADPSVWWNRQALVAAAPARLAAWSAGPRRLYFATSADGDAKGGVDELVAALRAAPADLTWRHEPMPDERHGTIFPTAALRGIRAVFAPR